jgi:hypothetical protein
LADAKLITIMRMMGKDASRVIVERTRRRPLRDGREGMGMGMIIMMMMTRTRRRWRR